MEKTDLQTIIELLDKVLISERKEIKDAFRELLMIAALTEANPEEPGPLTSLLSRMDALEAEVNSLRLGQNGSIFDGPMIGGRQYTWDDTSSTTWRKFAGGSTSSAIGAICSGNAGNGITYGSVTDAASSVSFENPDFNKMWAERLADAETTNKDKSDA